MGVDVVENNKNYRNAFTTLILIASIAAVVLSAWLLYSPVLQFEYIWDDIIVRKNMPDFYKIDNIFTYAFSHPYINHNYYRPLGFLSMLAESHLAPTQQAFVGHLINLMLFIGCAVLITMITHYLTHRGNNAKIMWPPLLAGVLFISHPALMTGPAWVSVRFDLSMTFFGLLLLMTQLAVQHRMWRATISGAFFLAAAFSKEMALAIALALPAWHLAIAGTHTPTIRRYAAWIYQQGHLHTYAAIFIAGVFYLLLRMQVLDQFITETTVYPGSTIEHIFYIGKTLALYMQLIFWPFNIIAPAFHETLPVASSDTYAISGIAFGVIAIIAAIAGKKLSGARWIPLTLLLLLLPLLNILMLPIKDNIVDMRFTFLPVAFLIPMLVTALAPLLGNTKRLWQTLASLLIAGWLGFGVMNILITLPLWKNDYAFWTWYVTRSPHSVESYQNLGYTLLRYGKYADSIHYTQLEINRTAKPSGGLLMNLGIGYIRNGQYQAGIDTLQRALVKPMSPQLQSLAQSHIAEANINLGNLLNAGNALQQSIAIDPDNLHAYMQKTHYMWLQHNTDDARQAVHEIQRLTGNNREHLVDALREAGINDDDIASIIKASIPEP